MLKDSEVLENISEQEPQLPHGWKEVKFGKEIDFISKKIATNTISLEQYISTDNMLPNKQGILKGASNLPSGKNVNQFLKSDILFSNIRTYFKKVWFANFEGGASADVLIFRPKKDNLNKQFLYYISSNDAFIKYTELTANGAKMPRGDKEAIKKFKFLLPPIVEQERIAEILGSLDDKIELNRAMNKTLEELAQAIFKSWFIDFAPVKAKCEVLTAGGSINDAELAAMKVISAKTSDQLLTMKSSSPAEYNELKQTAALFPAEFTTSELGKIPKTWQVKPLYQFGDIICGKTPSKKKNEYYEKGTIPFIKIPNMHNSIFVIKTNEYLTELGEKSQPKKILPKNSVCVSCIATVGKVILTTTKSHTNQQINSIIPKDNKSIYYLFFYMKNLNQLLHDMAGGGTTTLNLNTRNFSKIEIIEPYFKIVEEYYSSVKRSFEKILGNMIESQKLAELRDALLPKLLSGEISVAEAENKITELT